MKKSLLKTCVVWIRIQSENYDASLYDFLSVSECGLGFPISDAFLNFLTETAFFVIEMIKKNGRFSFPSVTVCFALHRSVIM